ncbi:hypothetical protein [Aurantibacillus circumpalustris]|uniref:hypothetical protein n=1 Tax=Aurantibacillus circumpalustris TaxID=3036359 RepID=UPI00295A7A60|nr:hypothetical protein [Aurantibacillus circumpalustris]
MNSKKFRLDINNNNPFTIKINASENETHTLIRLTKGAFCESLNILMTDKGVLAPKNIPSRKLSLLQLGDQSSFSINANFSSAKGFIEIEVYKGPWEEILLAEIEFSFSDAPYNISCNHENIEFTIGSDAESQIKVKANTNGGFDVDYILVKTGGQTVVQNHFFDEDSDTAQIIKRLHGRIKGRVKGVGFEERQIQFEKENTNNLNKTMLDSFVEGN